MDFLIDVDDVLAGFAPRTLPYVRAILGDDWAIPEGKWDIFNALSPSQEELIQAKMAMPGYCYGLPVNPGAKEFMASLRRHCDVYAVTAPNYTPNWVNERFIWLRDHFGFTKDRVVNTHAKHQVRGDIFLDDNPHHVLSWQKANPQGRALLWSTDFNRDIVADRHSSWDSVLEVVRSV